MVGESPAGWHPDPYGRHGQRYFDGTAWTEHVFDSGVQGVDPPLPAPAPPVAASPAYAPVPEPGFGSVPAPTYPPPSTPLAPRAWDSVVRPRFRAIHGLAVALTWLLGAAVVVAVAMVATFWDRRSLFVRSRDGGFVSFVEARRADDNAAAAVGVGFLVGLAIFVVLIVFLYRASKNTELWDRRPPRWAAGWTIGGWFIPLASFVIPFLTVREIWDRTPDPQGRRAAWGPVWGWWVTWVVPNLLFVAARNGGDATRDEFIRSDTLRSVGSVALGVAAVFLIVVVRRLDQRQASLDQGGLGEPVGSYPAPSGAPWPGPPAPGA